MKRLPIRKSGNTFFADNVLMLTTLLFFAAAFVSVAGCQESDMSNDKQTRLIAAENMRLKKDLEQRTDELAEQKRLYQSCLEEKEALLAENQTYLQGKEEIEKQAYEKSEGLMRLLTDHMQQQRNKLQAENETLKSRIESLEKELKQLSR